jgi:hypothetical protein
MRLKQRFLYFLPNQIPKTMHLLLYVNRNILTLASLGQDGPPRRIMEGLNKEKPSAFSALFLHFHLLLKACYQRFWKCKKPVITDWLFSCSGDRTRTCDLRVMSPTSSQLLHPAMYLSLLYFNFAQFVNRGLQR